MKSYRNSFYGFFLNFSNTRPRFSSFSGGTFFIGNPKGVRDFSRESGYIFSCFLHNGRILLYGMRILIVDDSGVMRRIHKNTLLEQKIPEEALVEAEDGAKALDIARNQKIDMFLVDWNMPNLDGLSFVKKIRLMPEYTKTPIIMITSEAARYNVMEAIQAGVTNYVVKPIRGNVLWDKISQYISVQ